MTVRELREALERFPEDAPVGFSDQDAGYGMVASWPNSISLLEKERIDRRMFEWENSHQDFDKLPERTVLIRG